MPGFQLHIPFRSLPILLLGATVDRGHDEDRRGPFHGLLGERRPTERRPHVVLAQHLQLMAARVVVVTPALGDQVQLQRIQRARRWRRALAGTRSDTLRRPQELGDVGDVKRPRAVRAHRAPPGQRIRQRPSAAHVGRREIDPLRRPGSDRNCRVDAGAGGATAGEQHHDQEHHAPAHR